MKPVKPYDVCPGCKENLYTVENPEEIKTWDEKCINLDCHLNFTQFMLKSNSEMHRMVFHTDRYHFLIIWSLKTVIRKREGLIHLLDVPPFKPDFEKLDDLDQKVKLWMTFS